MKRIIPLFKDDTDRIIIVSMLILSIFCICIPALVVIFFLKNHITENSYQITKAIFNLELLMFLISLLFLIPILGQLMGFIVAPVMAIINTIVIILAVCNIAKNNEIKIPVFYEFI